jgi:hypothetical protein
VEASIASDDEALDDAIEGMMNLGSKVATGWGSTWQFLISRELLAFRFIYIFSILCMFNLAAQEPDRRLVLTLARDGP